SASTNFGGMVSPMSLPWLPATASGDRVITLSRAGEIRVGPAICAQQSGSVEIGGGTTSATIYLNSPEPDTDYRVLVTPSYQNGSPTLGSNHITRVEKAATSFTVYVETAPGGGNAQGFEWFTTRR